MRGFLPLLLLAHPAAADPEATCDRVRAEAHSEAVVLYGASLQAEGAHVPEVTSLADPSAVPAHGLQARLSLSVSPSDMLRGRAIERVADAECARVTDSEALERVLAIGTRYGELEGARAELAYLEAHVGELDSLITEATARLESQRGTVIELTELASRRTSLRLRAADRREVVAMLEENVQAPPANLDGAIASYRSSALEVDRRHAAVRDLAAWHVDVRGGVAGADQADWFAVVEVRYALGGLWQGGADRRALDARRTELHHDLADLSVRVEQLRTTLRHSVEALELELQTIDGALAQLRSDRERIATLESARALRDRYAIDILELEARRAGVAALATTRRTLTKVTP